MKIKFKIYPIAEGLHPIITAKINGKTCRMLIDTGASKTVFDKNRISRFVKKSKLEKQESVAYGVVGQIAIDAVALNIKIGTLSIKNYVGMVMDLDNVNGAYGQFNIQPVDAVLGSDLLHKYKFIIDFNKEELRLRK